MANSSINGVTTVVNNRSGVTVELFDQTDNSLLGTAVTNAQGQWQTQLSLKANHLHRISAKALNVSSTQWAVRQINTLTEDFEKIPLQLLPLNTAVDIGNFLITNLSNRYPAIPNSIGTQSGAPFANHCLTISGRLAITLKYDNAKNFTCRVMNNQAPNIYRFYNNNILVYTITPSLADYDTLNISLPSFSKIEIETAPIRDPEYVDYIELDNIVITY
ncbi:hypothetical protein [Pseudomonas sp. SLFW]|uniref:hypothetical protein n=1 Tax=Pseudomonas sp. SLFW TaxID=2683259 RepID=UPI001412DC74|nr:hypothetical protein [Pseudomonas sp. SLFW]NBB13402.1 hypothetical protein [Pseudomonas sp. SLFW]